MPVVSVGYRLAPEHKAPAAVEDVTAVLKWLAHDAGAKTMLGMCHAESLRIGVAGDSAGGNLAAVASLLAPKVGCRWERITSLLPLHWHMLLVPVFMLLFVLFLVLLACCADGNTTGRSDAAVSRDGRAR